MEMNTQPRLDSRLLFFAALCLCLEPEAHARVVCRAARRFEMHPKLCGTCSPGNCCKNKQCNGCRPLPPCLKGQELYCSGTIDFLYTCRPCPSGTFSDAENSCCTAWQNCTSQGLRTFRAGNRTHNTQCGPGPTTVETQPDYTVASIFTVVTAAGIFVLLLMTFLLIVCTCTQKTTSPLVDEAESPEQPNPSESHLLEDDAQSYRFPEEEDGGKMAA